MPAHSHPFGRRRSGGAGGGWGAGPTAVNGDTGDNTGSSGAHSHGFTGTTINLAVQYVDAIIATKD